MELISIEAAIHTAVTNVLDLSMTVNLGDDQVSGFPFTYNPDDTSAMTKLVTAYLAAHPELTISDYTAPAVTTSDVDNERDRRRYLPLSVAIPSGTFTVNMDATAQANIQGLSTVGLYLQSQASTQTTPFRDYANVTHDLTSADLVALGLSVASHIQTLYEASWTLKATNPIPANFTDDSYWT